MATERKELFVLWKEESKKGNEYFKGTSTDGFNLIAFYNGTKKNPNEPDLRVHLRNSDGTSGDEYASLWCNVSEKTGNKYLAGYLNTPDRAKIIAFIRKADENPKKPYIKAYFREDLDKKAASKEEAPAKEEKPVEQPKKAVKAKQERLF